MAIASGTRLGPYEIQSLIGSGGMGEVYRALDTRLQRNVAIKVLPTAVAADQKRLARFEQEARTIAALNHPNVLVAYDIGMFDGAPYVVSELLEGETLRQFIRDGGPLSTRAVIDYGTQIAKGLAAAHERGIVHRDLKPENVFVTRDGRAKILDFGLAKLSPSGVFAPALAVAPTQVETEVGVVLGTVGYMSPEQVRGIDADHRSDIFSFGAILYELVSGRRAFHGPTRADTMTAILKEEPPELSDRGRPVPPGLVRIIGRCLEKEPERRFQSSSDLAFALEAASSGSGSELPSPTMVASRARRRHASWLVGAGAVVAVVALVAAIPYVARRWREPGAAPVVGRFIMTPPAGQRFASDVTQPGPRFALSPDGRAVAFVIEGAGQTAVWLRPLEAAEPVRVNGTDGVIGTPFWSPDGRSLAFFARGTLKAIELATGTARTICESPLSALESEGAWGTSAIVITQRRGFSICPVTGGSASAQWVYGESGPVAGGVPSHPQFLPDGRHLIFALRAPDVAYTGVFMSAVTDASRVEAGTRLLADQSLGAYAAGHLLFARDGMLMAQPFDSRAGTVSGAARPLTRSVEFDGGRALRLAASDSVMLYAAVESSQAELRWTSREGISGDPVVPAGEYGDFSLSPDGRRVAVVRNEPRVGRRLLWVFDVVTGTSRPLLKGPGGGAESSPVWSPDGESIAFSRYLSGRSSLATVRTAGGSVDEWVVDSGNSPQGNLATLDVDDWSPTIESLVYHDTMNLWVLPTASESRTPVKVNTVGPTIAARLSPDGKWIAYAAADAALNVYVEPWPQSGQRWIVSGRDGGTEPRWAPGPVGRELFFRTGPGDIVAIDITAQGPSPTPTPQVLFRMPLNGDARSDMYAVAPDGRFLIKTPLERRDTLVTVMNWTRMLD